MPTSVPRGSPAPTRVLPDGTESALGETKPAARPRGQVPAATNPMRGRASTRVFKPDPETGVAPGFTRCRNMRSRCRCSMCPAIHINSRSWLRSSSTHEPSDPPLRVVSRRNAATISFPTPRGSESRRGSRDSHPFSHENSREKQKNRPGRPVLSKAGGISHTAAGPAL